MYTLPVETVSAGASLPVSAGSAGTVGAVVLYNESPNLIRVSWGGSSDWLPAWTGDCFYMNQDKGFTGTFTLSGQAISSAGNAPSSVVAGKAYAPGEPVPGTYPVALVRQTNVGNSSLPTTAAQSVINDGNAAGATVVEATQSGQTTSSLNLVNDGTALIAPVSSGALLSALVVTPGGASTPATGSFGDSANPTNWALHGVADQVPASGIQSGTLPAGVTVPGANVSGSVASANSVPGVTYDSGLDAVDVKPLLFVGNSSGAGGGSIRAMSKVSGSGSGTYSHGCKVIPSCALVNTANGSNSTTYGSGSYTSTTVFIFQFNAQAFLGLCYVQ